MVICGVLRRLVEQRQDVVDQREEERREQGADERASPAGERSRRRGRPQAMLSSAKLTSMIGEPIWTWAAR